MKEMTLKVNSTTLKITADKEVDVRLAELFFQLAYEQHELSDNISFEATINAFEWFQKGYILANPQAKDNQIFEAFQLSLN